MSTIDTRWMMFNKEGDEIKHSKQNKSGFCVENTDSRGRTMRREENKNSIVLAQVEASVLEEGRGGRDISESVRSKSYFGDDIIVPNDSS